MWPTFKHDSPMSSSPIPVVRPWTPPDMDEQSSPHSDYFTDPIRSLPTPAKELGERWPLSTSTPPSFESSPEKLTEHRHPPAAPSQSRPKPVASLTEPYTPTKAFNHGDANNVPPRYPYTPDSARMSRTHTFPNVSALGPMPWDADADIPSSPVQNMLTSCISHLENLIRTRQPNEDQMEYIVTQLEALTSYLSAPEAQSRQSDDYLFPELETTPDGTGLGISGAPQILNGNRGEGAKALQEQSKYVVEVGQFIEGVRKYTLDLQERMDEVKQLNSIQLDIINDLRRELRSKKDKVQVQPQIAQEEDETNDEEVIAEEPKKSGFWFSVGQALDAVGDMLYEW